MYRRKRSFTGTSPFIPGVYTWFSKKFRLVSDLYRPIRFDPQGTRSIFVVDVLAI